MARNTSSGGGDGRSGGGGGGGGGSDGDGGGDTFYVAFRSPQQLRAFNAPYQLGRAPDAPPGAPDGRFETPHDAAKVRCASPWGPWAWP